MQLIFASNNKGKLKEINKRLPPEVNLITLWEEGITESIPEPYDTFRENAWGKAAYVFGKTGIACFAEDSGLLVPALQGAPGVYSARYAGEPADDTNNNTLLLHNMQGINERAAYYQSTICLMLEQDDIHYFEGQCHGQIAEQAHGQGGFGYDPLFIPQGDTRTFAEYGPDEKNAISHRGKAVADLATYLNDRFFRP